MKSPNIILQKAGLRVTLSRVNILNLFKYSKTRYLSADEIHQELLKQGNSINLSTVYRILSNFESAHIIRRRNFGTATNIYEIANEDILNYVVCIKCNRIINFKSKDLEKELNFMATRLGFKFISHTLYLQAYCDNPNCFPH